MVVGSEKHQIGLWSKQALERIVQDALPPSPRNYAVYYHYLAGDMPTLTTAFETATASGKMSQEQCSALYDAHIAADNMSSFLKDANTIIDNELMKVMDLITTSAKDNSQFGENLDKFSGKLKQDSSIDVLRDAVAKIAGETQVIAAQNQKLQGQLKTTTDQLSEMRTDFDRVHREAQIDPLTEIGNRKFFDRELVAKMQDAREQGTVMSVLMVDIDHFKRFNDTYGHLIGDQVLRLVAHTLVENLKGRDVIARYGGEEFVILLPDTRLGDAERVGNHLRDALASKHVTKRGSKEVLGVITVSIGATEYKPNEESDTLVARADTALYKAKQNGRNRVELLNAE